MREIDHRYVTPHVRRRSIGLAIAACLIAIAPVVGADDGGAPTDATADNIVSDADAARFLAFFDKLVDAAAQAKGNCDKLAADVERAIDEHREILEVVNAARAGGMQLPAAARDRVRAGVAKLRPGIASCVKNEKLHAAFRRMDATTK